MPYTITFNIVKRSPYLNGKKNAYSGTDVSDKAAVFFENVT
jgi:hypothetical protein